LIKNQGHPEKKKRKEKFKKISLSLSLSYTQVHQRIYKGNKNTFYRVDAAAFNKESFYSSEKKKSHSAEFQGMQRKRFKKPFFVTPHQISALTLFFFF
jgi:hypothetical protein